MKDFAVSIKSAYIVLLILRFMNVIDISWSIMLAPIYVWLILIIILLIVIFILD